LLEQIKKIAESPRGIVLVAGSTGCGKSTTLAAMIEHINANFKKHIITMEDPIEYVLRTINASWNKERSGWIPSRFIMRCGTSCARTPTSL